MEAELDARELKTTASVPPITTAATNNPIGRKFLVLARISLLSQERLEFN
jgi:hypothetical protein